MRKILLLLMILLSFNLTAVPFEDSLGRIVELPEKIETVVPSGNLAQMVLYSTAPDMIAGWSSKLSDKAASYFDQDVVNLPVFGTLYGKKANLNKEALMSADPDVVIDMGEIKGSKEAMISDLDRISEETMIPVIFINAYLDNTPEVYRITGELLGREERAEELAVFAEEAITMAAEARERIEYPVTVYYSSSPDGLSAIAAGNFHGEVIEKVGAENIVPSSFGESHGDISMEQLYIWNPDVILLESEEAYRKAVSSPEWQVLDAVREGRIYRIPDEPYPFIDSPPATNRIIGIYWLGALLYPELYPVDIVEKTMEYYALYYNHPLTESEAEKILFLN